MIVQRAGILQAIGLALYKIEVKKAVDLPGEGATGDLAASLAACAAAGDVIALKGDLGAGKTTFARAFIHARGVAGEVPSPTFTLVQVYDAGAVAIWHFDLYRLKSPEDAWELGIDDAFADGISLIEWPERLGPLLPDRRLEITLLFGREPNARRAVLAAGSCWQRRLDRIGAGV
jgi:tRNA threonylcarbamoyladenosine biosynthesis protein TsaE